MPPYIDMVGRVFGSLTVLSCAGWDRKGQATWHCRCACGREVTVIGTNLRSAHSKSCGCRRAAVFKAASTVHGHTSHTGKSSTYRSWRSMVQRCIYPKDIGYHRYGGRGITVCEQWRKFENFLADMGERPKGKTLDRINNDGDYEPGNCRWATPKEQNANRGAKS